MKRKVLGLVENLYIKVRKGDVVEEIKVRAKVDTGASKSSISKGLVKKLDLGPVRRTATIRSALGTEKRHIIKVPIKLRGKHLKVFFSVANRKHMKYGVLIGQNILN